MKSHHRNGFVFSVAVVLGLIAGCSEEKKKTHVEEVTGTIERIDIADGLVVVRTYSQKYNKELTFDVKVTPDTELLINGSIATLRDLKIGETAFGSVRIVEKDDDTKVITAIKVRVERAEVLKAPSAKPENNKDESVKNEDAKGESKDTGHAGHAHDEGGE